MKFVDRERALKILKAFWRSDNKLLIVYGRRRIGKSRLLKEFLRRLDPESYVYFLASNRPIRHNLVRFSKRLSSRFGFRVPHFDNFVDLFEFLRKFLGEKPFLIVIDEFTYLVEWDSGVLSDFQEIVDDVLSGTHIKLVLTGSLVGMMENRVLGRRSPLYGRSDRVIKLPPLEFRFLTDWFEIPNYEDLFKIYAVTGGVPRYLEFFRGQNIDKEIIANFFDSSSFLFRDAYELIKEELREPANYIAILEAIASGMTKLSEISDYTYLEPTKLTAYLSVLRNMGIVKRQVPLFAPKRTRRGLYIIGDYYFLFWFRFVSPYFDDIENNEPEEAINNFRQNFNAHLGFVFEDFVLKNIRHVLRKHGFRVKKLGKWWYKNIDIDFIAIDNTRKTAIFGETKWKELSKKDVYRILAKLEEKANMVPQTRNAKKTYCIVARKFTRRIEEKDLILVELRDLVRRKISENHQY